MVSAARERLVGKEAQMVVAAAQEAHALRRSSSQPVSHD